MARPYARALFLAVTLGLALPGLAVAQIPTDFLGYWPLDETSGPVLDVGGGHDGTAVGITRGVPGVAGNAAHFNGSSYVLIPHTPDFPTSQVTILAWVKFDSVGNYPMFLSGGGNDGQGWDYALYATPDGRFRTAYRAANGSTPYVDSSTVIQLNVWYHAAMTHDGTNLSIYVNGVLEQRVAAPPLAPSTRDFYLGRESRPECCFLSGYLDEVQLYGRSLQPSEVQAIEAAGVAGEPLAPPAGSPASCTAILLDGDSVGDGVYTIDPAQDGNDVSVYCDMTTDGGGWTLVGYGADSNLGGNLTVANGSYNPLSRTGSANISAVALARASAEASLSWSFGAANGNLGTYNEAVGFPIPDPANQTLNPDNGGYLCTGSQWTEVALTPLVGAPDLPAQMYTRTTSLGASYGYAYGLVRSDGNPQCDWYIDGQGFRAVYLGINSGYQFRGVVDNPGGESNHVVPATMAIWFRGAVDDVVTDPTPPVVTPSITGTLGSNDWYVSNVQVTWTVTDEESEATTTGCEAQSVVADTAGVTFTCSATSEGGTAEASVTIKRDATAPTAAIAAPADGASLVLLQAIAADYACGDTLSGIASCTGTVLSGANIDTASVGSKSFSVTSTDLAGNSASSVVTYTVGYTFTGFLQPIPLPVSTFKGGSTVPVKFRLSDGAGASVGTAVARVSVNGGAPLGTAVYDEAAQQYHFNLKTRGLPLGPLTITVALDDGTTRSVVVTLK